MFGLVIDSGAAHIYQLFFAAVGIYWSLRPEKRVCDELQPAVKVKGHSRSTSAEERCLVPASSAGLFCPCVLFIPDPADLLTSPPATGLV